jgi:hypothetical protein
MTILLTWNYSIRDSGMNSMLLFFISAILCAFNLSWNQNQLTQQVSHFHWNGSNFSNLGSIMAIKPTPVLDIWCHCRLLTFPLTRKFRLNSNTLEFGVLCTCWPDNHIRDRIRKTNETMSYLCSCFIYVTIFMQNSVEYKAEKRCIVKQ